MVDEQALFEALRDRRIAGAAINFWYQYPGEGAQAEPSGLPFSALDNVLMTPHLSGVTIDTFRGRMDGICQNLRARMQRFKADSPIRFRQGAPTSRNDSRCRALANLLRRPPRGRRAVSFVRQRVGCDWTWTTPPQRLGRAGSPRRGE